MCALRPAYRWLLASFAFLVFALIGVVYHLNADPVDTIPRQVLPTPNAFDYDVRAGNALVDSDKVQEALGIQRYGTSRRPPAYTLSQKEALIRENAPALKLVRAGFAFRYLSPYRAESDPFPYYAKFRAIARLLRLEGQVNAAHGNWGGVATSDLDAICLGEDIPHGGGYLGLEMGNFCQHEGRKPLWALVPHLTAKQAKDAALRLETIQARHMSYAKTMQQEEWSGQAGLLKIFHAHNWRQEMSDEMFATLVDNDAAHTLRPFFQAKLLFISKQAMYADYTRYMDQYVRIAHFPYAAKVPVQPLPLDPIHTLMFSSMGFDYGTTRILDAKCETDNALLAATLAIRAYHLDHGTLPNTLQMLIPAYLHKIPDDPFALSGPLRYQQNVSQFVVYSIGPDGKDDHGVPIYDPTQPVPSKPGAYNQRYGVTDSSKGDVVAGINLD